MSTITIPINSNPVEFNYSITKTSDSKKKDRFWAVKVSHQNNNVTHIPQQFVFTYDTLNNIMQSKIDGAHEEIAKKIIEQEGL